ncbi:Ulp1 family isopeptidase, partial [Pantoea agglomerans]|uniref:Ulp1 family isopeptidase n=1 Tax=Enterobacter agglomerans TaxID=549 RepID=UPI003CF72EDE
GKRKKLNIFEKDLTFIPININSSHWALSVINNITKTVEYYDSLNLLGGSNILHSIKGYMIGEIERLGLHDSIDINDWQLAIKSSPQQLNGYDCG